MKYISCLFVISLGVLLGSCGGGSGRSDLPPVRPVATVDGNAVDAVIVNGNVSVYSYSGGMKGAKLATSRTDKRGYYSLGLQAPSQPIVIEITGGRYTEEASGQSVPLQDDQKLRAITLYESGQPVTIMVTPLTHLSAGLAEYKVAHGISIENAIAESSLAVSTIFGLDILSTYPRNITDPNNASISLTNEHLYGFWTAAISSWTAWASKQNGRKAHDIWTSIKLSQVMYDDIRSDGMLDGKGFLGEGKQLQRLGLGTVILTADVYRQAFARHLIKIANSELNKTGIIAERLLAEVNSYAANTHETFGKDSPKPLDDEGPVISAVQPDGQYYSGLFTFSVTVADFVGIDSVLFDMDGNDLGSITDPAIPKIDIDSSRLIDGEHQIGVRAKDKLGNESYRQFMVNIDNTSPIVNITSPSVTNQAAFTLTGTFQDNGVGVNYIIAQGKNAILKEDRTWSVGVSLDTGVNSISVSVEDGLGNVSVLNTLIGLDVTKPSISAETYGLTRFSTGDGSYYTDNLDIGRGGSINLYIETDKLDLNGVPLSVVAFKENHIPYFSFDVIDKNVNGVFTEASKIKVKMRYSLSGKVLTPWYDLAPDVQSWLGDNYAVPLVSETLHDSWYLSTPNDLHAIEIYLEDEAGNIFNFKFDFRVDFVVPPLTITSTDVGKPVFSSTAFDARAVLHNRDIRTVEYEFTNLTGKPFFIKLDDENRMHTFRNLVEKGIRENRARLKTITQWRAKGINVLSINSDTCPAPGFYVPDWTDITKISKYVEAGSGSRFEPVYLPAPELGVVEYFYEDQPASPAASTWQAIHLDNLHYTVTPNAYAGSTSWQYDYRFDYPGFYIGPPAYLNVPACNVEINYFQQRKLYEYVVESGFPVNRFSTFEESAIFGTTQIIVEDSTGNLIFPDGGWYSIPVNEKITISKTVTTPLMSVYNDTDVADPATFSSYSPRSLDKTLTWTVDNALTIYRAHDAGIENVSKMVQLPVHVGTQPAKYQLSR